MANPRLAGRYAKSLLELSIEQNQLEAVYKDMQYLHALCVSNRDFVDVLKSPIIPSDKKEKILETVTASSTGNLTQLFLKLLIRKTREYSLPEVVSAFMDQYNTLNGIHRLKITTAVPVSADMHQAIVEKVKANTGIQKVELETAVNEALVGGFTLQLGDTFLDASIKRDLNDIHKQFRDNQYVHSIR
jgi:F-type H+-transporting ATPase subunit delta